MRSSNSRMGSRPASLESWPGEGSMTSGVPKKSRTWGQVSGILISGLRGRGKTWRLNKLDAHGSDRFQAPFHVRSEDLPLGFSALAVPPMSEVTRILSAIEQGDPHAAEQLLP